MSSRSPITTHILDTSLGRPAALVAVSLERQEAGGWSRIAFGTSNPDGRVETLLPPGTAAPAGIYRLSFDTGAYFRTQKTKAFYPSVEVIFEITAPNEHHHVPLLLNPFGYSTYRGS